MNMLFGNDEACVAKDRGDIKPRVVLGNKCAGLADFVDVDYRSRTWCLSSVFRLGLRAKVAVI